MKPILEYLNRQILKNKSLEILFELDESSIDLLDESLQQYIFEGNRLIFTSNDGDELRIGDHATQRLDRPQEKGGDGEKIDLQEIINMFKWAWDDIVEMQYDGKFKYFRDSNNRLVNAWSIECQCYLTGKDKLRCTGARPENKTLWAIFMVEENSYKITITIKTLFRGARMNHIAQQERIKILRNGNVQQRYKR